MDDYGFTQVEADTLYFPKKMTQVLAIIGDKLFADLGIKSYHLSVLRVIYDHDGIDQKSIRKVIPFDTSREGRPPCRPEPRVKTPVPRP